MENLSRKLTKSNNKMLAGVCAGLAEYLGWDITLLRVVYLILSMFTAAFPGLLLYILLCIVMPQPE
ncbi:MAG: PspC domain-containing protein [Paludibacteraceae bacterium]|nr:PspC domain-containing protein [Paludibacteraceae bacterium]